VQVAPAKDEPIRGLAAADFDVRVGGRSRPVSSVTLLHYDMGTVTRGIISARARADKRSLADCVFGFHRRTERTSAHYLVGVEAIEADRKGVARIRINMVDKAFAVQWVSWRLPR
jgi:hypothetical protein